MQIERLRGLVDRLENRVNFEGIKEEQKDVPEEQMMLLVHRRFPVSPDRMKAFRGSLRMYIEGTNEDERCLNVSVLTYSGSDMFILYEMWESKEAWKSHLMSSLAKNFQHSNIDNLQQPESCNSMPIPSAWWKRD
ncbi:N-terminal EF-hand calcium-binding protein 1-like [Lingula anatina]|uniref:N-terminal EF-hand calcium-binding protein 1-like n=1 Tax=Lingula anatina TaxID=7574 RepID=A0A1S3JWU9_LINAN|nr:N-terminal EF-hand calcium-binding protein 1-like [Lingula anatina]|eukprot:XP_013414782.1 N-terminal EF-hand calcium-binding protein 1-like [Lingula anatina]